MFSGENYSAFERHVYRSALVTCETLSVFGLAPEAETGHKLIVLFNR